MEPSVEVNITLGGTTSIEVSFGVLNTTPPWPLPPPPLAPLPAAFPVEPAALEPPAPPVALLAEQAAARPTPLRSAKTRGPGSVRRFDLSTERLLVVRKRNERLAHEDTRSGKALASTTEAA